MAYCDAQQGRSVSQLVVHIADILFRWKHLLQASGIPGEAYLRALRTSALATASLSIIPPMAPPLASDPCPLSCRLGTCPNLSDAELTGLRELGGEVKLVDRLAGAGMLVIRGKAWEAMRGR